jgi:hypothetical protein
MANLAQLLLPGRDDGREVGGDVCAGKEGGLREAVRVDEQLNARIKVALAVSEWASPQHKFKVHKISG